MIDNLLSQLSEVQKSMIRIRERMVAMLETLAFVMLCSSAMLSSLATSYVWWMSFHISLRFGRVKMLVAMSSAYKEDACV